jgi:hypothetical protein
MRIIEGFCKVLNLQIYLESPEIFYSKWFCKNDYNLSSKSKVVIDIGANIGVSSLFFFIRLCRKSICL